MGRRAPLVLVMVPGLLLGLSGCGKRRPPFDVDQARQELAQAFGRSEDQLAIYADARAGAAEPIQWIVDFRVDGFSLDLQARFTGTREEWVLDAMRTNPQGNPPGEWAWPSQVIAETRREAAERAETTMARMSELADLIERLAADRANAYPTVDLEGLHALLVQGDYTANWVYSADAWGSPLVYHAAPDGQSYVLLSPGSDGQWDQDLETYYANTDAGLESYDGMSSDPERDLIHATGAFVQSYAPGS
jgi:hypothetical protein